MPRAFLILAFALIGLALTPAGARAATLKIKVVQSNGAAFPAGVTPTISWGQRTGGDDWSAATVASRIAGKGDTELTLATGTWFVGASEPDGYRASYRLSANDPLRSFPRNGLPVVLQSSVATELVISYDSAAEPKLPVYTPLRCGGESRKLLYATEGKESFGSTVGVRVGLSPDLGGVISGLELIDSAEKSRRLGLIAEQGHADGALQTKLSYGEGKLRYQLNQGLGYSKWQWGYRAALKDLVQTDWLPLYPDRTEPKDLGPGLVTNPCFTSAPERQLDGKAAVSFDTVTTPRGAKVVRLTSAYEFRSRADYDFGEWNPLQSLALSKVTAANQDLAVHLVGPARAWQSETLRPQAPGFVPEESSHCDLAFSKDDDSGKTLKNECQISSVAYALFLWRFAGKDVGFAVVNDRGAPFGARLVMHKALSCREPTEYSPFPKCGGLEWATYFGRGTDGKAGGLSLKSLKKEETVSYQARYFFGSADELAELGFTYEGGPRPSTDIALNMVREGSASVAIDGTGVTAGATAADPSAVSSHAALELDGSVIDESPLDLILGNASEPKRGPASLPTLSPDVVKLSLPKSATVPLGLRGHLLTDSELQRGGARFFMVAGHSNMCIGLEKDKAAQWSCLGSNPERLHLRLSGAGLGSLAGGAGHAWCLRVNNSLKLEGADATVGACGGATPATEYRAVALPDGRFYFKSLVSGKCLDVRGASRAEGAALQEAECAFGRMQQAFTLVTVE